MSVNGLGLRLTNTQYIWLDRRHQLAKLNLIAIIASNFPNNYYFKFSVTVHDLLLGSSQTGSRAYICSSVLTPTADASIALSDVPALVTTSRSLTSTAVATLGHAFITARLHY